MAIGRCIKGLVQRLSVVLLYVAAACIAEAEDQRENSSIRDTVKKKGLLLAVSVECSLIHLKALYHFIASHDPEFLVFVSMHISNQCDGFVSERLCDIHLTILHFLFGDYSGLNL